MPQDREATPAPGSLPGRLSQVLRELASVPEAEIGAGWDRVLAPGTVIGRFELVREVGRGGFGVVYEARDRDLGRTVAFKAVRPGAPLDVHEERLLREAEAAARLAHPNIVTLYDVGRSEQGPYLVLEYLRGQTLARRIDAGTISAREALRIGLEIAKGVAHAHANGIVHRDLTPLNVFLCDDGQVKILDLGIAHAFGRPKIEGGTPGFMAPEQRRGAPEDQRTDVFALGVILYRMLASEHPFPDGEEARGPVARLDVSGAPALGELVARMLEQDPERRPRDASEVVDALTGFLRELEWTSTGRVAVQARRRRPRPLAIAVVAAGLLAAAAVAGRVTSRAGLDVGAPAAHPRIAPSIAVLPFADLSPQSDEEYFSDGLADEILNALARIEGLRVPSRTSSFAFKGTSAKLSEIGKELDVRTVLEGSVRRSGNRVRVTARIVDVADGRPLWGDTYDRELTDVFAVQDDIARAAVRALDLKLQRAQEPSSRSRATENPEVYTQYLFGRQQYYRYTLEGFRLAVEAYERAVALEPGYAPAWSGLGPPLYNLASLASNPDAVAAERRRALAAAQKAVELAPDLPEALSARGILRSLVEHDWAGARADLERALRLNPNDADGHRRYGVLLQDLGRLPEAIAELRKAVDLDPLGPSWAMLGHLHQAAGQLELAEAAYRRHLRISPDAIPALAGLGRTLVLQSRWEEARAAFDRCLEPDRLWSQAVVGHALGHAGPSRAALDELVSRHAHTNTLEIAEVLAWRGDKDAAFEWLERGLASRAAGMAGLFRTDPFLRPLREDPRYPALLRKMHLPEE